MFAIPRTFVVVGLFGASAPACTDTLAVAHGEPDASGPPPTCPAPRFLSGQTPSGAVSSNGSLAADLEGFYTCGAGWLTLTWSEGTSGADAGTGRVIVARVTIPRSVAAGLLQGVEPCSIHEVIAGVAGPSASCSFVGAITPTSGTSPLLHVTGTLSASEGGFTLSAPVDQTPCSYIVCD